MHSQYYYDVVEIVWAWGSCSFGCVHTRLERAHPPARDHICRVQFIMWIIKLNTKYGWRARARAHTHTFIYIYVCSWKVQMEHCFSCANDVQVSLLARLIASTLCFIYVMRIGRMSMSNIIRIHINTNREINKTAHSFELHTKRQLSDVNIGIPTVWASSVCYFVCAMTQFSRLTHTSSARDSDQRHEIERGRVCACVCVLLLLTKKVTKSEKKK